MARAHPEDIAFFPDATDGEKRVFRFQREVTALDDPLEARPALRLGLGNRGVEVYHFHELCARVLGEPVHFENEDSEY